jgi:3-oxoacyl-[acyl-carrier-protein] synthase-1
MSPPVFVRFGIATPLGLSSQATSCAIAAGLTGFTTTEARDRAGDPARASRLAQLGAETPREDRMLFLARHALAECLAELDPRRLTSIACYLALPESHGRPFDEAYVVRGVRDLAGAQLPLDWSARPLRLGRAGVFHALEAATGLIASGRAPLALIGGVDSHCDRGSLRHLIQHDRILGRHNLDGLIPGEGAGFVLLARRDASHAFGPPRGQLLSAATARDALPFGQRSPLPAVGLTTAFRQLRRAHAGQPRPQLLYSCQTAESFWGRELNHAYLRNGELMPEPFRTTTIADSLGDAGAASPVVQLAMACRGLAMGARAGRPISHAIVYGAADHGEVGACIVARSG